MRKNVFSCFSTLAVALACLLAAPLSRAETGANIGIDGRGLLHVGDILKDGPKCGMGLLFTGKIWAGGSGLAIREEFFDVSTGGPAKA